MDYQEYVDLGLNGKESLKLILCGEVQLEDEQKLGVVSVVFATENKELAEQKLKELNKTYPNKYYMVYSVPLDIDLNTLDHYPSIAINSEDLK